MSESGEERIYCLKIKHKMYIFFLGLLGTTFLHTYYVHLLKKCIQIYINYHLLLLTVLRLADNNFSLLMFHRFSFYLVTLSAVSIFLYFTNEGVFLYYSTPLWDHLLFCLDDCLDDGLNVQLA